MSVNLFKTRKKWILLEDAAHSLKVSPRVTLKIVKECNIPLAVKQHQGAQRTFVGVAGFKKSLAR